MICYDLFDQNDNFIKRIHYFGYLQELIKNNPFFYYSVIIKDHSTRPFVKGIKNV